MLQSYQDVTFPKHILQSKEPNTNSQVQVLLKLPRYTMFENRFCPECCSFHSVLLKLPRFTMFENRFCPECCSFHSVWAGHTDFIENRYWKMAWKIGNSMKECMTFSWEFWAFLIFITVFIDWIIKLFREIRKSRKLMTCRFYGNKYMFSLIMVIKNLAKVVMQRYNYPKLIWMKQNISFACSNYRSNWQLSYMLERTEPYRNSEKKRCPLNRDTV